MLLFFFFLLMLALAWGVADEYQSLLKHAPPPTKTPPAISVSNTPAPAKENPAVPTEVNAPKLETTESNEAQTSAKAISGETNSSPALDATITHKP